MLKELDLFHNLDNLDDNKTLFLGLKSAIDGIVCSPTSVLAFKEFLPDKIRLICMIDYPYGMSCSLSRQNACIDAAKHGATDVDIVINHNYFKNKHIDKIKKDLLPLKEICTEKGVNMRIMIESRLLEEKDIISVVRAIYNMGFREFLLSTSAYAEDYLDNLILFNVLKKKFGDIKVICTGGIWREEQYKNVLKSEIYGIRLNSAHNLSFLKVYN